MKNKIEYYCKNADNDLIKHFVDLYTKHLDIKDHFKFSPDCQIYINFWNEDLSINYKKISDTEFENLEKNQLLVNINSPNSFEGEIDQIFLSYLILFLSEDNTDRKIHFKYKVDGNITNDLNDLFFILKQQLEQIRYLYGFKENQITQSLVKIDNNRTENEKKYSLYSLKEQVFKYEEKLIDGKIEKSKKYGNNEEVKNFKKQIKKYNLEPVIDNEFDIYNIKNNLYYYKNEEIAHRNNIKISRKFAPLLFINKTQESVDKFFKPIDSVSDKKIIFLQNQYLDKINNDINIKLNIENINEKLKNLSFFEISLCYLLLNNKTFSPLSGKGVNTEKKVENIGLNKFRFEEFLKYINEIARGIKELALNIQQHASTKQGVISLKVFKKEKLIEILGKIDNDYSKYFEKSFENTFLSIKEQNFININVIDYGESSIKESYIKNLEKDKDSYSKNVENIKIVNEIESDIKYLNKEIENKDFSYKDLFIIGKHFFALNHQKNKLISRYGLHHFTALLLFKLNALIKVSSNDEEISFYKEDKNLIFSFIEGHNEKKHNEEKPTKCFKRGTSYSCIFPLKTNFEVEAKKKVEIEKITTKKHVLGENSNIFSNLDDIEKIKIRENIDLNSFLLQNKNESIKKIYDSVLENNKNDIGKILILDFLNKDEQSLKLDKSEWVRLLSALNAIFKNIIVINIPKEIVKEIVTERKEISLFNEIIEDEYKDKFTFWNTQKHILFYSTQKLSEKEKYYRYGATLLTGKNVEQFNYLNQKISNSRYSYPKDGIFETNNNQSEEQLEKSLAADDYYNGNLFFNDKHLIYFELIINISEKEKMSLFEKSIQYSLNKEYEIINQGYSNGYKISNTHFKLGSKIHIPDFYYAKRLFQNSFFTNPLAYLLAKYITDNFNLQKNIPYTIVGYEEYSDSLVSMVRFFTDSILNMNGNNKLKYDINHFTISKDAILSRDKDKLHENVIVIVPIASTFSTGIKIKKDLEGIMERIVIDLERKFERYSKKIKDISINDKLIIIKKRLNENKTDFIYKRKVLIELIKLIDKEINDSQNGQIGNIENLNINITNLYNKIENFIFSDKESKINIIGDFLNLIVVGNDDFDSFESENENCRIEKINNVLKYKENSIEKKMKWESIEIENKKIEVYPYTSTDLIKNKQKYFIPLYTEWQFDYDCKYCFPKLISDAISPVIEQSSDKKIDRFERCLIEMVENTISPNIVFGYPRVNKEENTSHSLDYNGSFYFGNLKKEKNNFLYFFKTGNLLNKNKKDIDKWIKFLKENVFKEITGKVIIVTPAGEAKSNFIDLINEKVFNFTANTIYITIGRDYIENTLSLYSNALINADCVIFIDDILSSARTFIEVNYVVKYIRSQFGIDTGLDYAISLINRMSLDVENNVRSKLTDTKYFHYFSKIYSPEIQEPNHDFPIKLEYNRYKLLEEISCLDSLRIKYNTKKNELKKIDLVTRVPDYSHKEEPDYLNRKLFQFMVQNAIFKLFEVEDNKYIEQDNINSFFNNIGNNGEQKNKSDVIDQYEKFKKNVLNKINELHTINKTLIDDYKERIKIPIFKILCSTPLIYYKNIKETTFKWVENDIKIIEKEILDFNKQNSKNLFSNGFLNIDAIEENVKNDLFLIESDNKKINQYSKYDDYLFYLKRYVDLNGNHIIRENFLKVVKHILEIREKCDSNIEYPTSREIIIDFLKLAQDLVLHHESKSIQLEKNIKKIINEDEINYLSNNKTSNFYHYLRLLRLENTEIAFKYWDDFRNEHIKVYGYNKCMDAKKIDNKITEYVNQKLNVIKKLFDENDYKNFLKIKVEFYNREINRNYNNEHNNCSKLNNDKQKKEESSITGFVKEILKYAKKIIGNNVKESYFTVNFKNSYKNIQLEDIYTFQADDESNFVLQNNLENSFSYKFFENGSDFFKEEISNFEIYRKEKNGEFLFREGVFNDDFDINTLSEVNSIKEKEEFNLLFIRISDFYSDGTNGDKKDKLYTQGVLTFYIDEPSRLDERKLRLLLLLRKTFSRYLKNEVTETAFLELVSNRNEESFRSSLRHGLSEFIENQDIIMKSFYSKLKDKI